MGVEAIGTWLDWPRHDWPRLQPLADAALTGTYELPAPGRARVLLERLDVPPQAIVQIVDGLPAAAGPEANWLLERLHHAVVAGEDGWFDPPWPAPWPNTDPFTHHFHAYVFLAALPHVLDAHASRGIPEEITWSTLSDIGLQIANYEVRLGCPGFDGAVWMWPHFRGGVFRLGRLQYDLTTIDFEDKGVRRGEEAVAVHIPALGPLLPEACDASFAEARRFFPRHFPERSHRVVTCDSWLMDDQLADYLPESSNILHFQRRFRIADGYRDANIDVVRYVFGYLPDSLDELPLGSSVQRAVVEHLRSGGTWRMRNGWFVL